MSDFMKDIHAQAAGLPEEMRSRIELERVELRAGAIRFVAPYAADKGYRRLVLVADANTYEAAGKSAEASLTAAGIDVPVARIQPNAIGDVVADEASIVQLLLEIQRHRAEAVLAVGSGTLHDIARYAAYTAGIPFLSVPTAPSVDGFNSKGAPLLIRGDKITVAAIGPDAIFADLDILAQAPPPLVAAGFGDMLGKYTSLFDWRFGALVHDEPYLEASAAMTRSALQRCVDHAGLIGKRDEEGIAILTGALIESGFAMLLFGQSHPASGAEHHLSHYWEMDSIRQGRKQLLHGAKVGVACAEISRLYHRLADEGPDRWRGRERIAGLWGEIAALVRRIPDAETIADLLRAAGGPTSPGELGIGEALVSRSLREAHRIRPNRYTLLHAYNEA
ncbi:sn-glycerol-1-phosphate dehydrogenase [Cohnella sp. REN36]|uniref:sn-glycerol-1-phosphate dehydrogenase n=1 Tax=Cohnella sp. REN36 TaxID=2887347 RepID=UPI001D15A955|nr:sn-glycerol-1-phosphate dehydrogenase [Cohnella sp. REN36]MCC3375321.1 sn-glycerol-1-phosphate dehydrogenase [Cohnella sp. REN36]